MLKKKGSRNLYRNFWDFVLADSNFLLKNDNQKKQIYLGCKFVAGKLEPNTLQISL